MALIELTFADHAELKKQGKGFDCSTCPERIQKIRKCREERWDFTEKDNPSLWPMQVHSGGTRYGFCPAKSTWDVEVVDLFQSLLVSHTTGVLLYDGGINHNPGWYVELLAWFIPIYSQYDWATKAKMILGDGKERAKDGNKQRYPKNRRGAR